LVAGSFRLSPVFHLGRASDDTWIHCDSADSVRPGVREKTV